MTSNRSGVIVPLTIMRRNNDNKKIRTCRFRLKTKNKSLRNRLAQEAGYVRYVSNYAVTILREARHKGIRISYAKLCKMLTALKKDPNVAWLNEANAQSLQQALKEQIIAERDFALGKKGQPRFKNKYKDCSFKVPQSFKAGDGFVYIPKIGILKYINSQPIEGTIKQIVIKKEADNHWYITFFTEMIIEIATKEPSEEGFVGIDLGINSLLSISTGQIYENHRLLKKNLDKLRNYQQQLSQARRGSSNYKKIKRKLTRLHRRIACQRRDLAHKITTELVKSHDGFAVESLEIKNMLKNRRLAQSISDVGWGIILTLLCYKAEAAGKPVVKIDRFFPSSKICSVCGVKQDMPLSVRIFDCKSCGLILDRDINAAKNIRSAGISALSEKSAKTCNMNNEAGIRGFQTT